VLVARAAAHLDLPHRVKDTFKKGDPLIAPDKKPPDLLFYTAKCLWEEGDPNAALQRFDRLTSRHPDTPYAREAYLLKGEILMDLKRYEEAAEAFSLALNDQTEPCDRMKLLITKANAFNRAQNGKQALEALKEADRIRGECDDQTLRLYREMGDLYLQFGYAKAALDFFMQLLSTDREPAGRIPIKFKIAQCYGLLDKEQESLKLYEQIADLNEPFWSDLAKERISEINFNREMSSMAAK
jgi:tetratricopeptide (TPR) repeat protein